MVSRNVVRILAALLLALALVACGGGAGPVGEDNGKTPAPGTYTVSGTVVDADDNALQGVTLGVAGSSTKTETDADGKWSLSDLTSTSVITPTHADYTFNPASQTVTKAAGNINFIGTKTSGTTQLGITVTASSEIAGFEEPIELVATVTGDDAASAVVTWTVDPNAGLFSANTGEEVTWTTPNNVGKYTITATANANGQSVSDSAEISVCDSGCIYTLEDLDNVREDLTANYFLMNDIDASETQTEWGTEGFPPIGSNTVPFTGTFDGQGYTISGLYIYLPEANFVGMFGAINSLAEIKDISLEQVSVSGDQVVGTLIGENNGGHVTDVDAQGTVNGNHTVGGVIGHNTSAGSISRSNSYVNVTGTDSERNFIGGLVGVNSDTARVSYSNSYGEVRGFKDVGGLVGRNGHTNTATIIQGYSEASVIGLGDTSENVGGLVGFNEGLIDRAWAHGEVTGHQSIGGLVGFNTGAGEVRDAEVNATVLGNGFNSSRIGGLVGTNTDGARIKDSESDGVVSGRTNTGGLVGHNENASIADSKSSSQVSVTADGNLSPTRIGGLVGLNNGPITHSSSSGAVNGGSDTGGLIGRNDSDGVITISTSTSSVSATQAVGGLIGRNYGTVSNSSSQGSVQGNMRVGGLIGVHFNEPVTDSFSTTSIEPVGEDPHEIGGLIGRVSREGTPGQIFIDNVYSFGDVSGHESIGGLVGWSYALVLTNSYSTGSVVGTGNNVGGLIGYATSDQGSITQSFSEAQVSGFENVGGLVGHNDGATISQSYALPYEGANANARDVTGWAYVGGLVGRNSHTIIDSYSWSSVSSSKEAGGLVGWNDTEGTIENSYSATVAVEGTQPYEGGLVGQGVNNAVVASYWDTESSGVFTSAGGTGKDTSEMQNPTTFSTWDTDIWEFPAGYYPNLKNNPRE